MQQLEHAFHAIPYIEQAYVVSVEDEKVGRRVGIIGRFAGPVTLQGLRDDLASHVPPFMLPTAFRALSDNEKIPLAHSGKVSKMDVLKQFFPFVSGVGLSSEVHLLDLDF